MTVETIEDWREAMELIERYAQAARALPVLPSPDSIAMFDELAYECTTFVARQSLLQTNVVPFEARGRR